MPKIHLIFGLRTGLKITPNILKDSLSFAHGNHLRISLNMPRKTDVKLILIASRHSP
jgi:hypothetical protein